MFSTLDYRWSPDLNESDPQATAELISNMRELENEFDFTSSQFKEENVHENNTAWQCLRIARMMRSLRDDPEVQYAVWRAAQGTYNGAYESGIKSVLTQNGFHDRNKGELLALELPHTSIDIAQNAIFEFLGTPPFKVVNLEENLMTKRLLYITPSIIVRITHDYTKLGCKTPYYGYMRTDYYVDDITGEFEKRLQKK